MKTIRIMVIGLVFVLLLVPFAAAAAVESPGSAADDNRPTVIVEYGKGIHAGLVRVTHIHYAKAADKAKPAKPATCYKLAGWKWSPPLQYMIQDTEYQPDQPALAGPVAAATKAWDDATSRTLFLPAGTASGKTWRTLDNVNLVTYGDYGTDGVIAVTVTWYNRLTRTAVESDILFDTDFTWSITGDSAMMDVQNIATHEIGHTLGLSDLYTTSCSPVTMYGYSWEGDTAKQTLEQPDRTGIQKIYGV